ncbi:nitroreductase family protein [Mailhella sp.]|uniref:nitroreductase family protein n=1 Tax=Mailhella sp. TaxID=1981029 RepID=UPI00406374BE
MIQIDHERCIRCGLCARVCPLHCFICDGGKVRTQHEQFCMHCGQCTAVCGRAAITLEGRPSTELERMKPFPSAESFEALAKGRRSVRNFSADPVDRDILLRALDIARYAPTGKNLENVTWLVLEGRERLRRVADAVVDACRHEKAMAGVIRAHENGDDPIFRGANCAVFACADSHYDLSACNCDIAVTFLELALPTLGLGACWAGFVMRAAIMDANVRRVMGVEEGQTPFAGLMVGRPLFGYSRIPARRELRVTWLGDTE